MSTMTEHRCHEGKEHGACAEFGQFERLNYFYGQMLSAQDFTTEQSFFREKMKLHNRCLHGYGTVCGLLVEPVDMPKECPPADEADLTALEAKLEEVIEQKGATAKTV